jgi:CRISPR-associated endonuclease/helicase Cas3
LLLKYHYRRDKVILLHSRFTYNDRREREEQLEKSFHDSKPFVFVSTQVAEVSLDMSFDYLFTELAPIPSLIQRFGRVNRYSDSTDSVNVTVTRLGEMQESKFYPYDESELTFAFNALCGLENRIRSEVELIKELENAPMMIDDVGIDEIEKYLKKWEEDTRYFYSVDLDKEEMNKILKFRETNTALVIPVHFKEEVIEILHSEKKFKSQLIKGHFVPVPIWWLLDDPKCISPEENLPFLANPRFSYSGDVGYFDRKRLVDFLKDIG